MKLKHFKRDNMGFDYYFEDELSSNEIVYVKMPTISANKRSVNDIGWQCENDTTIYATLSHKLTDDENTLWTEIQNEQGINKTVQFLKVVAGAEGGKVYIRTNLN